ncbi:hypothetical protein [Streptomyces sp. NPDC051452]|uniref:hypothetical protein n=1 Tax=Streptomyces sp. NPDC051452 TaxID=3365654 RepID=UPI00378DB6DA
MADEHNKWLDRATAERLLRGEPLEAVDPRGRDQAERLSRALGALSAQAAPASAELPGEQGALAAFRKAREAAEAERTAAAFADGRPGVRADGRDAGLVRIGGPGRTGIPARRPPWARPVRLALAAVVAVGTLGGVAVAAGSGVLPTPFGDGHPAPTTSVTAETSERPLDSASPPATPGLVPGTPGGGAGTPGGEAARPDDDTQSSAASGSGGPSGDPGTGWKAAATACRDLLNGRDPGGARKRALEDLAGGSARVTRYCKAVLAAGGPLPGSTNGDKGGPNTGGGSDPGKGKDTDGNGDKGHGKGGSGGRGGDKGDKGDGRGGDEDGHPGKGHGEGRRHGGGEVRHHGADNRRPRAAVPLPAATAPVAPAPSVVALARHGRPARSGDPGAPGRASVLSPSGPHRTSDPRHPLPRNTA